MIEALLHVDVWLFYAVNHGWSNPVFDAIMPVITNSRYWLPVYILGCLYLVVRQGGKGRWCTVTLVGTVVLLDQASAHFLKEAIGRLRPYDALGDVIQLVGSGGGSFPSNHAMNNAAAAVILSAFYPSLRPLWWSIAVVMAFSRVYCGVHYPSDVLGGMALGALVGWGVVHFVGHFVGHEVGHEVGH